MQEGSQLGNPVTDASWEECESDLYRIKLRGYKDRMAALAHPKGLMQLGNIIITD